MSNLLKASGIQKTFVDGQNHIDVLKGVDFSLDYAERVAIVGPSGSGKSTLLHLLSGLDFPSSGDIVLAEKNWRQLSEQGRCRFRNESLGFVYQFHHLLPELTAYENVMLPLMMQKISMAEIKDRASSLLEQMGLGQRLSHRPHQLSGGERQRIAIARAMVSKPLCIFADEPTGNLDTKTADIVFKLWNELNQSSNTAMVIVTHDIRLAKQMDKIYELRSGFLTPLES
jgi:lipoprotein-releasing system ATP-binding protein